MTVPSHKLQEECGYTSVNRLAKERDATISDVEEFFACAEDLARQEEDEVIVGSTDVTSTGPKVIGEGRMARRDPHHSEKGERVVIDGDSREVDAVIQDTLNVKSSPATGPRTDVKEERPVDSHEALGKTVEYWDREKRG